MRFLCSILLVLAAASVPLYGANGDAAIRPAGEESLTDMKYDREFLTGRRDEFINRAGDLPVKDIIIRGLKRTRASLVLSDTGIRTSEKISLFDPHRFINRMKKRNLFSEIDINYKKDGEGVTIEIEVEEKWTLIPLPMFVSNSHGTKYGLYLMESNFMGYGKFLFAGGTYSPDGGTGMLGYMDPSVAGSRMLMNLFTVYSRKVSQKSDTRGDIYSEYMGVKKTARLDLGYSFSDRFRLFASGGYESDTADDSCDEPLNLPGDQKAWTAGWIARYEKLAHCEYLCYGQKIEVSCIRHIASDEEYRGFTATGYKLDCSFRTPGCGRVSISSNASAGDRPEISGEIIGGKPGGRTLPADIISADDYINCTLTGEYPLLKFGWGAITLLAFWEQGVYRNSATGTNRYSGPGAGIMFYLKRLALPAMGFNIARNINTHSNEFSFSAGFGF